MCVLIPLGGHILAGHVDDTRGQLGIFRLELIMYHCNGDGRRCIRPHHLPCNVWECVGVCESVGGRDGALPPLPLCLSRFLALSVSLSSILSEYGQDTEGRGTHQLLVQD